MRASISGGQPRELLENVRLADWSPDGTELAIARWVDGQSRIEYPVGKVLWESQLAPFSLKISPDAQRVAVSHYGAGSRIGITVIDRNGKIEALGLVSGQTTLVEGSALRWTSDGREIWFRSFDTDQMGTIYSLRSNKERHVVARFPGTVRLLDVDRQGRMLLATENRRLGILGQAPGEIMERDLSCLNTSSLRGISADGRTILANALGEASGPKGSIYLRKTDGTPPVRLGDGVAFGFSPDGRWVSGYSSRETSDRRFLLMPAGAGEEVEVRIPELKDQRGLVVGWLPGNQHYLVWGVMPGGKPWQLFSWNAATRQLRPLTRDGLRDTISLVSPDGSKFLAAGKDSRWAVYPMDGGEPKPAEGIHEHDSPIGWRSDGRTLFVATHRDENKSIPVSIVDVETGMRSEWKVIQPRIPVDEALNVQITPDGKAYAYNYSYVRSELYLVNGFKPGY
jgi:Tol biopolymer transport system component